MDNIFTAIKALIIKLSSLYPATNIYKAFNNSFAVPANNNFVIMTLYPEIKSHALLPVYSYDTTLEKETWKQIDEATFQVDFYGDNAITVSALFRAALQSAYATNYFLQNGYDCVVGVVKPTKNLTETIDRDMYTLRYAVVFSVQFNNKLTVNTLGFTEVSFNTKLVQ
jgi:hypothetical protein